MRVQTKTQITAYRAGRGLGSLNEMEILRREKARTFNWGNEESGKVSFKRWQDGDLQTVGEAEHVRDHAPENAQHRDLDRQVTTTPWEPTP